MQCSKLFARFYPNMQSMLITRLIFSLISKHLDLDCLVRSSYDKNADYSLLVMKSTKPIAGSNSDQHITYLLYYIKWHKIILAFLSYVKEYTIFLYSFNTENSNYTCTVSNLRYWSVFRTCGFHCIVNFATSYQI